MIGNLFGRWTCLLLILGATILWLSTGLVFTQDELSALSRLNFDGLPDLLQQGVRPDGHPAFVQVFLYLWTGLLGTSEWAVKIPSVICGILSMYITYRIVSRYFDWVLALILVSWIGFIQYYAFYFSIGRPYAFGTFFILLQIYSVLKWKEQYASEPSSRNMNLWKVLFVLSSLAAGLSHYFATLCAIIVGVWGLYEHWGKGRKTYFLLSLLSLLLFLPHLPITIHQLSIGGVGAWLSAPEADFFWNYLQLLTQHSDLILAFIVLSLLMTVVKWKKLNASQHSLIILGALLMIIPFCLGFYYSRTVNPVLQYSTLIFGSIPFLWTLLAGLNRLSKGLKLAILPIVCISSIYGLMVTQGYPQKMEHQLYDDIATQVQEANQAGRVPRVISVMDQGFLGVYKDRKDLDYDYVQTADLSLEAIRLEVLDAGQGVIAQVTEPAEFLYMAHDEFGGEHFQGPTFELWNSVGGDSKLIPLIDTAGETGMSYAVGEEYKVTFAFQLADLKNYPYLTAVVDLDIEGESAGEGVLVLELHAGEDKLVWRGQDVRTSSIVQSGGALKAYHALRLQEVLKEIDGCSDLLLVAYYWNKAKGAVATGPIRLRVYPDVKTRYGFFDKMPS